MSWWTKFRDRAEHIGTLGFYDPVRSRREEADARYAINDQIKAYKEQSQLTREELSRVRNEQAMEKRRIQEKQIRALRRNYRPQGLLGTGSAPADDVSQKLGG